MMEGVVSVFDSVLTYLGDVLWGFFSPIANFFLGFFPDADSGVVSSIEGFGSAMQGWGMGDFNLFYFIDIGVVLTVLNAVLVCGMAYGGVMLVKWVISVIHKVMDSIPIIG